MRIHVTEMTKKFLPEKTYETVERGILEVSEKVSLKTYIVIGKYSKLGNLDKFPYAENRAEEDRRIDLKNAKENTKWEGFKLL